jgi:two-component sensor histidine kinase
MVRKLSSHAVSAVAGPRAAWIGADEARQIFDALDRGVCVVELKFNDAGQCIDYVFVELNAAFEEQTGLHNAVGKSMRDLRAEHEQHWFDIYGEVARTGVPKRFTAEAAALGRWYDVYACRVGEPESNRVAIVFEDITGRKQLEERYALVSSEVEHRFRNMFSLVSSLVRLTTADTLAEYKTALLRRFTALFASTSNIGSRKLATSDFGELVRIEMAPYQAGGRISLAGAAVLLDDSVLECLGVVLHELATNAVKYGALSSPNGRVSVRWRSTDGMLRVRWQEADGPQLDGKPARLGIGATVVERCIREQLKGDISFEWRVNGLVSEFAVPVIRPQKSVPN